MTQAEFEALRSAVGISDERLARFMGVTPRTVARWIAGGAPPWVDRFASVFLAVPPSARIAVVQGILART